MDYLIRDMQFTDLESIAKLVTHSWQENYKNIIHQSTLDKLNWQEKAQAFKERYGDNKSTTFIAENKKNSDVLGFVSFGSLRDSNRLQSDDNYHLFPYSGEIYAIYLSNQFKGFGIGSALLKSAFLALKKNNRHDIMIWTLKENILAQRFYQRHGGVESDIRKIEVDGRFYYEVQYRYDLSKLHHDEISENNTLSKV